MFSKTSRQSLYYLDELINYAKKNVPNGESHPMLVIGNKCDALANIEVSCDEAIEFATKKHGLPYLEVSAKSNHNINSVF